MYAEGLKFMVESGTADKHAAITIPQCSKHFCGAAEYGRHPHSQ